MEVTELELRITEQEGDVRDIYLDPEEMPEACRRKKYELVHNSGMTTEEADRHILTTPIPLEFFYDIDRGLFAVEAEAGECSEVYNPYTGREIPNDNLPPKEEKSPQWRLSEITCQLEELNSELQEIWESGDFSLEDEERIENARYSIDDALAELHSIGDEENEDETL
jgi:hypothetical protein